ncbi:MAG: hypothetical protein E3J66_07605 [Dehalococcoidia bacterium]|nr:MAG: hypothetical protein E3J66_07605 [Dehalococcoidia bacterium]
MGKSKQRNHLKTKTFIAGLRDIVSAVPTESDKQEIQRSFSVVIEFLTSLQKNFDALPSTEDMNKVSQAIQKLDRLFVKAEADPVLASTLGLRRPTPTRRSKLTITEDETAKAKATLAKLESLTIDEIRSQLQSKTYSMSELRAIASVMGIRSTKGINRDTLVHQITMKIANYRGYQRL